MHEVDGFAFMEYVAAQAPAMPVIVITGYASTTSAIAALRKGAYDYIAKPFDIEMLRVSVARAPEKVHLQWYSRPTCRTSKAGLPSVPRLWRRAIGSCTAPWLNSNGAHEQLIQTEKLRPRVHDPHRGCNS